MERQEAIKKLVKAGQGAEVQKLLDETAEKAGRVYRHISEDATLSEKGRNYRLAASYQSISNGLNTKLSDMASRAVTDDRDDAERVFGIKGLPGDSASLVISRRDAADRVARVESREELRDLLAQATRTGDEVLARAIAERAVRDADSKTMHAFVADRPELDAAAERLWNAEQASAAGGLGIGGLGALSALRPDELRGMAEYEIAELAKAGEPPAEIKEPAFSGSAPGAVMSPGFGDIYSAASDIAL